MELWRNRNIFFTEASISHWRAKFNAQTFPRYTWKVSFLNTPRQTGDNNCSVKSGADSRSFQWGQTPRKSLTSTLKIQLWRHAPATNNSCKLSLCTHTPLHCTNVDDCSSHKIPRSKLCLCTSKLSLGHHRAFCVQYPNTLQTLSFQHSQKPFLLSEIRFCHNSHCCLWVSDRTAVLPFEIWRPARSRASYPE